MHYHFNKYRFDSTQANLYLGESRIPLKSKAADILSLLLSDTNKIFSKEEILAEVWKGSIVTDQAVFQNISDLRVILGDDAIKTFPRKGYQWQIPLTHQQSKISQKRYLTEPKFWCAALTSIFVIGILIFVYHANTDGTNKNTIRIALSPAEIHLEKNHERLSAESIQQDFINEIESSPTISTSEVSAPLDIQGISSDPKRRLDILNDSKAQLILQTHIYILEDGFLAYITLTGKTNAWTGWIESNSYNTLLSKTVQHIKISSQLEYLNSEMTPRQIRSEQLSLYSAHTDDPIIITNLISKLIHTHEDEAARVFIDKLLDGKHSNTIHEANARIENSLLLTKKQEFDSALRQIELALDIYKQKQVIDKIANTLQQSARVLGNLEKYNESKSRYLETARLLQQHQHNEWEFYTYLELASVAFHFKNPQDSTLFMQKAERLLDQYQLDKRHFASAYLTFGLISNESTTQEHYLNRVLDVLDEDKEGMGAFHGAQSLLTDLYIREERWDDAMTLFGDPSTHCQHEKVLVTQVLFHSNKLNEAKSLAKNIFDEAIVQASSEEALDAALILFSIYKQNNDEEFKFYQQYILDNAGTGWINLRREKVKRSKVFEI